MRETSRRPVAQKPEAGGDAGARIRVQLARRRDPRARPSSGACRCARRAGRRCPSSRAQCAGACPASLDEMQRRMLCSRSASLTSSTRMSSDIASTSLRKFSACLVWSDCNSMRDSLVTPSTSRAISGPNSRSISSSVATVSSTVSCRQAGDDRGGVELHLRQQAGDLDRVREIRVARGAQLRAVRLHGIDIGAVERVLVRLRVVGLDLLDQLELPHHGAVASVLAGPRRRAGGDRPQPRGGGLTGQTARAGGLPCLADPDRRRRLRAPPPRRPVFAISSSAISARRRAPRTTRPRLRPPTVSRSSSSSLLDRFLVELVLADHRAGGIGDAEQRLFRDPARPRARRSRHASACRAPANPCR